jgi:hypothetical protein
LAQGLPILGIEVELENTGVMAELDQAGKVTLAVLKVAGSIVTGFIAG